MGGQLGSSSCSLALYSSPARVPCPHFLLCQLAPHGCEDSAAIEISAFRRISGEADMSYFFREKKPAHFVPSKGQLKPAKFLTTKNCLSSWSKVTDAKSLTTKNAKRKTDCGFELRATRI